MDEFNIKQVFYWYYIMRKNHITGAIKGAGRKKGTDEKHIVKLTITKDAKLILDQQPRMEKGNFVSELIINTK